MILFTFKSLLILLAINGIKNAFKLSFRFVFFSVVMATKELGRQRKLRRGKGTKFLVVQTLTIKKKRRG
jgi:hypothetical protein